jgi:hypothetical protein
VRQICEPSSGNLIIIAEITEAEIAAALNQLVRGKTIRKKTCDTALATFWDHIDAGEYRTIPATSALVRRAADLCGAHALKGYDSIQRACALAARDVQRATDAVIAANGRSVLGDPNFLTEDNRLATAATAEGFTVGSPLAHP